MNKFWAIALIGLSGCFALQQESINTNFNNRIQALDAQCKNDMTDWCKEQYQIARENKAQELGDLQIRREAFSRSMQEASKSFDNSNQVRCTSYTSGRYTNTNCR